MTGGGHARRSVRTHWSTLAFVVFATCVVAYWLREFHVGQWYGVAVFTILGLKFVASSAPRETTFTAAQMARVHKMKLCVIVPSANEDPLTLTRCMESILRQSRKPDYLVLVFDGPSTPESRRAGYDMAFKMRQAGIMVEVADWYQNHGKREGIATAVRLFPDADVYLGVDSDTVLKDLAIYRGMRRFADPGVTGVTGLVLALNATKNLLTRLIDTRYANAFMYERAAYSSIGSVLCQCGSLAFYRGDIVRKYLPDFLNQWFLGRRATYGDDRRLTNYMLLEGQVVFEGSAVAWTLVPYRVRHFLRQQIRWNKSFFRESMWVIQHMSLRKPATWLTAIEFASWVLFTIALICSLLIAPFYIGANVFWGYLGYILLLGYVRSVRYLEVGTVHNIGRKDRIIGFLVSPLYGVLHVLFLLPLRLVALATLRDNGWGTRKKIEVGIST